jgi:hypothetical protein
VLSAAAAAAGGKLAVAQAGTCGLNVAPSSLGLTGCVCCCSAAAAAAAAAGGRLAMGALPGPPLLRQLSSP